MGGRSARRTSSRPIDAAKQLCRAGGAVLFLFTGCAAPPPPPPAPPPPTVVEIQISADKTVNATPEGQGAPVTIRVYQLASTSTFEAAEFYRLYSADAATLGADLIKRDEVLLIPGSAKSLTLTPPDPVHAVGVFAAYRDFQRAVWRAATDIPAHRTTTITVSADGAGIKLAATPARPAPGQPASP